MKKFLLAAIAAVASVGPAVAADLITKGPVTAVAPPPPAWDLAFGSAVTSDYLFRGISQSNKNPSVNAYFEPRWNINANNQLYVGMAGNSISFPNRAAAEIDFYAGWRPTIGKLALDFGVWYYWYPGGTCYNRVAPGVGADCIANADPVTGGLPINGNLIKEDLSFVEFYAKAGYNFTDQFAIGFAYYYSPSVLNSGATGNYFNGNAKFTFASWGEITPYVSGEVGYWDLGTTDSFYGSFKMPSYTHWNVGVGFAWKVLTLDLRYHDTDLNKGNCNAFTGDQGASGPGSSITPINAGGFSSNWCGQRFVATLKADLTFLSNLK